MKTGKNSTFLKVMTVLLLGGAVVVTGAFAFTETGLAAKYLGQEQSGDEARVARFDVSETGAIMTKDAAISVVPGKPASESLVITNNSEVAVRCTITVKNKTANLCGPMTMALYEGEEEVAPTGGSTPTEAIYELEFAPNSEEKTYQMKFTIPESEETAEPDPNLAYMGMADHITISVISEQID